MRSTVVRLNEREIEILTKAVAKYNAELIKETKGTNYLEFSTEPKYIERLLMKFNCCNRLFNQ